MKNPPAVHFTLDEGAFVGLSEDALLDHFPMPMLLAVHKRPMTGDNEFRIVNFRDQVPHHIPGSGCLSRSECIPKMKIPLTHRINDVIVVAGARNQRCLRLDEVWL